MKKNERQREIVVTDEMIEAAWKVTLEYDLGDTWISPNDLMIREMIRAALSKYEAPR